MHYTPIEQRIIDLLKDGMPHDRNELLACLRDKQAGFPALAVHIYNLRSKVRAMNHEIVTELYKGSIHYRRVVLLSGIPADAIC